MSEQNKDHDDQLKRICGTDKENWIDGGIYRALSTPLSTPRHSVARRMMMSPAHGTTNTCDVTTTSHDHIRQQQTTARPPRPIHSRPGMRIQSLYLGDTSADFFVNLFHDDGNHKWMEPIWTTRQISPSLERRLKEASHIRNDDNNNNNNDSNNNDLTTRRHGCYPTIDDDGSNTLIVHAHGDCGYGNVAFARSSEDRAWFAREMFCSVNAQCIWNKSMQSFTKLMSRCVEDARQHRQDVKVAFGERGDQYVILVGARRIYFSSTIPKALQERLEESIQLHRKVYYVKLFFGQGYFIWDEDGVNWHLPLYSPALFHELRKGGDDQIIDFALARDGNWIVLRPNRFSASHDIHGDIKAILSNFYRVQRARQEERERDIQEFHRSTPIGEKKRCILQMNDYASMDSLESSRQQEFKELDLQTSKRSRISDPDAVSPKNSRHDKDLLYNNDSNQANMPRASAPPNQAQASKAPKQRERTASRSTGPVATNDSVSPQIIVDDTESRASSGINANIRHSSLVQPNHLVVPQGKCNAGQVAQPQPPQTLSTTTNGTPQSEPAKPLEDLKETVFSTAATTSTDAAPAVLVANSFMSPTTTSSTATKTSITSDPSSLDKPKPCVSLSTASESANDASPTSKHFALMCPFPRVSTTFELPRPLDVFKCVEKIEFRRLRQIVYDLRSDRVARLQKLQQPWLACLPEQTEVDGADNMNHSCKPKSLEATLQALRLCQKLETFVEDFFQYLEANKSCPAFVFDSFGYATYEMTYHQTDPTFRGMLFADGLPIPSCRSTSDSTSCTSRKFSSTTFSLQGMCTDLRIALTGGFAHQVLCCENHEVRLLCSLAQQLDVHHLVPTLLDFREHRMEWLQLIAVAHNVTEEVAARLPAQIICQGESYLTWISSQHSATTSTGSTGTGQTCVQQQKQVQFLSRKLQEEILVLRDYLLLHPRFRWTSRDHAELALQQQQVVSQGQSGASLETSHLLGIGFEGSSISIESVLLERIVQSCAQEVLSLLHRFFHEQNWSVRARLFNGLLVEAEQTTCRMECGVSLRDELVSAELWCRSHGWEIRLTEIPLFGKQDEPLGVISQAREALQVIVP